MKDFQIIKNKLKELLKEKRYEHSIRVFETAEKLAEIYHEDKTLIKTAALLHDCARNLDVGEMRNLIKEDIELSSDDYLYPEIIHGFAGAVMARNYFRIEDKNILNAIKYHTIGREGMTTFEKIIYISDWIEPGRTCEKIDAVRKAAYINIDEAVLMAVKNEIEHLLTQGKTIHINTVKMRNRIIRDLFPQKVFSFLF